MNGPNSAALAEQPSSRLQAELQRALGFGEADLAANRAGRITRRQAVRLAFHDAGTWLVFAVMAIAVIGSVFFVFAVPIVALFGSGGLPGGIGEVLKSEIVVVGLAILFGWGAKYYLDKSRRSLADIRAGAVTSCEGPMSVIQERVEMARGYSYVYILLAGGERYGVPFDVYRVFEDGEKYRAFFMPESKVVVAIEALDQLSESAGLRHRHRSYPLEMRLGLLVLLPVLLVIGVAILVAGLLLGNLPAALLGLGTLLLSGFLVRALVRSW